MGEGEAQLLSQSIDLECNNSGIQVQNGKKKPH